MRLRTAKKILGLVGSGRPRDRRYSARQVREAVDRCVRFLCRLAARTA
jgi:hypothetical protein